MGAIKVIIPPLCEPVTLAEIKQHLHVVSANDDELISAYIEAAREWCEEFTGRSFVNKGYLQTLDTFPYYVDSNPALIGYGPSFYTWPRYATTLWNEAQRIRLYYSELRSVSKIKYLDATTLTFQELHPSSNVAGKDGDFVADYISKPPRLFPNPGQFWPAAAYTPNAVEVFYVAGYNDDEEIAYLVNEFAQGSPAPSPEDIQEYEIGLRQNSAPPGNIPGRMKQAIRFLVGHYYENREAVSNLKLVDVPQGIEALLWSERVYDLDTTRQ